MSDHRDTLLEQHALSDAERRRAPRRRLDLHRHLLLRRRLAATLLRRRRAAGGGVGRGGDGRRAEEAEAKEPRVGAPPLVGRDRDEGERVLRRLVELLLEGAVRREQVRRRPAALGQCGDERPHCIEGLLDVVVGRRRAKGQQQRRRDAQRLAGGGVAAHRREELGELVGRLARERAAAERERVEHDAHKPVAPRRRARAALRLADEEQRLEQLDRRRRRQHARVQQRRDEADEPADVHRRVVVQRALQLVLRAGRHRRAELVVRRVEQPDERAVDRRLRLQPVHAVEDRVGDQRAVQRQVALQRAREAVEVRREVLHVLIADLDDEIDQAGLVRLVGGLVVAAAALHRN